MKSYGKNFLDRTYRDSGILRNQKISFNNQNNRNSSKISVINDIVKYRVEYDGGKIYLPYVPIQPQTLIITVDGLLGEFVDFSTVDLHTGETVLVFNSNVAMGSTIRISYFLLVSIMIGL